MHLRYRCALKCAMIPEIVHLSLPVLPHLTIIVVFASGRRRSFTVSKSLQQCHDEFVHMAAQRIADLPLNALRARAPQEDTAAQIAVEAAIDALRAPERAIVKQGGAGGVRLRRTKQQVWDGCALCGPNKKVS